MFKPTLKRSINDNILPTLSKNIQTIKNTNNNKKQYINQHKNYYDNSIPQFFTKSINFNNTINQLSKIINPINSWNLQYPYQVKEKLNQPIQEVKSRIIGTKFGVYWLLTQNSLYLWRYDSLDNPSQLKLQRKFEFEENIRAISIGHLNGEICSIMQRNQNCEIMAIGYQNAIDLYKINIITLQLWTMQVRIKLKNRERLEKLQITNNNQILFIGDEGYLSRVSFESYDIFGGSKMVLSSARPLKRSKLLWNIFDGEKKCNRIFSESILSAKCGKIYVLIRKQYQKSMMSRLSQAALEYFSGKIREQQQKYRIQKQIHIYRTVDGNGENRLKYDGTITNYQIQKKIKQSYYANQIISQFFDKNCQRYSSNSITNIYLNQYIKQEENQHLEKLAVVVNYGLFITIRQNISNDGSRFDSFGFDEQPKTLPQQLFYRNKREDSMAFFMKGKSKEEALNQLSKQANSNQFQPLLQQKSKIIYSLGMNNINFFENGLCAYISEQAIQFVKLERYPGFLMQSEIHYEEQKLKRNKIWCIFSKNQITIMRKLETYECLLAFVIGMMEVQMEGIANGENAEQYQRYRSLLIEDICRIVGKKQICQGLCMLILTIIRNNIGELPQINKMGQSRLFINNELKQVVKQEIGIKMKLRNRFRSFQSGTSGQKCSLFSKWFTIRKKDIKLEEVSITKQIEEIIWKLFTCYSLEKFNECEQIPYGNKNYMCNGNNYQNISVLSIFLINKFRYNYNLIKNISITQLRKLPQKIKQIKINFLTLLTFFQQKKNNSYNYLKKLTYYKTQLIDTNKYKKDDFLNKTTDQTNDTFNKIIFNQSKDQIYHNQTNNIISNNFNTYQSIQQSREQIQNQLNKFISKVISVIQLYQILAANSQRQYQYIPNIQNFFTLFSAKNQVKLAFLDLYISTELWNQPIILKYNTLLPELRLDSDIYLSKWLKYIYDKKQTSLSESINTRISISDIKQLSEKLQLQQIIKIRYLFREICPLYIKILINKLQYRKLQQDIRQKQIIRYDEKYDNNERQSIVTRSIFVLDRIKSNTEWKQWIATQIINIRFQIMNYLKNLTNQINQSYPQQYLQKQKLLDDSIRVLQNCQEGLNFIKELIGYLKDNNIMHDKIYRFSLIIQPKTKTPVNSIAENAKPELMSSFSLLNNSVKRNREEILSQLNYSRIEERVKNGQSTTIL